MSYRPGYRFMPTPPAHIYTRRWDHALEPLQQLPRQVMAVVAEEVTVIDYSNISGSLKVRTDDGVEGWLG